MGTGGTYGFKINKEIKVIMTHYDAYPGGLGADIIKFIEAVDVNRLAEKVAELQSIPKDLIKKNPLADKKIWEDPEQVLNAIYKGTLKSFFSAQEFTEDYLFCEYTYIINLDTKELECYESGVMLSMGNYPLADLNRHALDKMKHCIHNNAEAKANLLGYKHYPQTED